MKKVYFLIAVCAFSANVFAGNNGDEHGDKYCTKMKNGKLTVVHEGKALTSETTLSDGSRITPDGTIIKTDGSRTTLGEGECVTKEGKMMEEKNKNESKKMKKESKKEPSQY